MTASGVSADSSFTGLPYPLDDPRRQHEHAQLGGGQPREGLAQPAVPQRHIRCQRGPARLGERQHALPAVLAVGTAVDQTAGLQLGEDPGQRLRLLAFLAADAQRRALAHPSQVAEHGHLGVAQRGSVALHSQPASQSQHSRPQRWCHLGRDDLTIHRYYAITYHPACYVFAAAANGAQITQNQLSTTGRTAWQGAPAGLASRLPAVPTGGHAVLPLERLGEGEFGGVSRALRDGLYRLVAVAQQSRRQGHPPPGQVAQRRFADQRGEPAGEGRARQSGFRAQRLDRPLPGGFLVDMAQRCGDRRIAQGRGPPGGRGRRPPARRTRPAGCTEA
ncbi:hypothetical protein SCOCK_140191 [Actinacidiphila cocklensis]|uniref:Uncharacterized protein n=1 Tax=Actinacidiphila cocklensis TaxID=887465 RepID=A0A9W4GP41_9ACTN|nr:hypothetical protein SCOCK_140191 [Actinacidiphila cocklensis]